MDICRILHEILPVQCVHHNFTGLWPTSRPTCWCNTIICHLMWIFYTRFEKPWGKVYFLAKNVYTWGEKTQRSLHNFSKKMAKKVFYEQTCVNLSLHEFASRWNGSSVRLNTMIHRLYISKRRLPIRNRHSSCTKKKYIIIMINTYMKIIEKIQKCRSNISV